MSSPSRPELNIGRVFQRAFTLEGVNRDRLFKAIGIPLVLMVAIPILAVLTGFIRGPRLGLQLALPMVPVVAALAIGVHRVVLMSPVDAHASGEGFSASARRLLQYLLAAAALVVAFDLVSGVVAKVVLSALTNQPPRVARSWAFIAGGTAGALALSRFLLVLPAIAINAPQPVLSSWRVSQGQGIRIAFVCVAIPWGSAALFQLVFPRGTTWPQFIALLVLATLLTVIGIAAVSFACRALTAPTATIASGNGDARGS